MEPMEELSKKIQESVFQNYTEISEVAEKDIDSFRRKMLKYGLISVEQKTLSDMIEKGLISYLKLSTESEEELQETCHKFLAVLLELGEKDAIGHQSIGLSRDLRREWRSLASDCGSFLSKETSQAEEDETLNKVGPIKAENIPVQKLGHGQKRYEGHHDNDNEAARAFKSQYNEIVRILQKQKLTVKLADQLCESKIITPSIRKQFALFLRDESLIQCKAVLGELRTLIERAVEPKQQLKRVLGVLCSPAFHDHFKCVIETISQKFDIAIPSLLSADGATGTTTTQQAQRHLQSTPGSDDDLAQLPYRIYDKKSVSDVIDPCKRLLFLRYQNKFLPNVLVTGKSGNWKCYDIATSTPAASKTREPGGALDLHCIPLEETDQYPPRTLIIGPPGVGKSSIAIELCKRWSSKQLLQEYEYVILLQANDHSLIQTDEVRSSIKNNSLGEKMLFIIDGYDEFNGSDQQKFCNQIIKGEILSEAAVIVTTRPWCVEQLQELSVFSKIEIQGFTIKSRQDYIQKHTSSLEDCFPKSFEACTSNPFYLTTLIKVFSTNKVSSVQPFKPSFQLPAVNTSFIPITKLYWLLVQTLIYDFCRTKLLHAFYRFGHIVPECDFSSLPRAVYIPFFEICMLSYKSLFIDKVHFLELNDEQPTFNLLTKLESFELSGKARHVFRHSSLQEYLAAYFISRMNKRGKAEESIASLLRSSDQKYDSIIEFLYGFECITSIQHQKLKEYHELHSFDLIRQLCEAVNSKELITDVYRKESRATTGHDRYTSIYRTWPLPVPFDFLCLGRVIALSKCEWALGFTLRPLEDEHIQMLCKGIKSAESDQPIGRLRKIKFSLSRITEKGISYINDIPEPCLSSIDEVQLRGIGLTSTSELRRLLPILKGLRTLFLHDNNFAETNEQARLLTDLIEHCHHLTHISLSGLSTDECKQLLQYHSLKKVELWRISTSSCKALIENLTPSKTSIRLHSLEIYQTEVSKEVVQILAHLLPDFNVTCLKLINCNIDCESVSIIASAVERCMQLGSEMSIDISDNTVIQEKGMGIFCVKFTTKRF